MVFLIFLKKFLGISGLPPPAPPKAGWKWGVILWAMLSLWQRYEQQNFRERLIDESLNS